jgi:hypothetical protein
MTGQHPRFRSHVRRRKNGEVKVYYFYDRRPDGKPDVPLGTDYQEALKRWAEVHNRLPRIAGTLEEAFSQWEEKALPVYSNAETRRGYAKHLRRLRPAFGEALWHEVELKELKGYLEKRGGKTQANREVSLLSIIWNWARTEGLTDLPFPAAGMQRSRWKNREKARKFRVTDDLFALVYAEADQVLRDCMDLASATGMRLTDCRTVLLPRGDTLTLEASKTGKAADFDLSLSAVLPELIARRRALKASHLMLLSTSTRIPRPISQRMLRDRWDEARATAAGKLDNLAAAADGDEREHLVALAAQVRAMWLRDMRKRAADLAADDEAAAELLQHSDVRVTRKHYRSAGKLRPVR